MSPRYTHRREQSRTEKCSHLPKSTISSPRCSLRSSRFKRLNHTRLASYAEGTPRVAEMCAQAAARPQVRYRRLPTCQLSRPSLLSSRCAQLKTVTDPIMKRNAIICLSSTFRRRDAPQAAFTILDSELCALALPFRRRVTPSQEQSQRPPSKGQTRSIMCFGAVPRRRPLCTGGKRSQSWTKPQRNHARDPEPCALALVSVAEPCTVKSSHTSQRPCSDPQHHVSPCCPSSPTPMQPEGRPQPWTHPRCNHVSGTRLPSRTSAQSIEPSECESRLGTQSCVWPCFSVAELSGRKQSQQPLSDPRHHVSKRCPSSPTSVR